MFGKPKPLIGMLHIPPLPGSPGHQAALSELRDWVLREQPSSRQPTIRTT